MTVVENFWRRVNKTDTCWLWGGTHNPDGYGLFRYTVAPGIYKSEYAHRFAYVLEFGPIPEGLEVDHVCKVRDCVRPIKEHLEAVTKTVNLQRADKWGSLLTSCVNGHPYTPENTYRAKTKTGRPGRRCKTCMLKNVRAYRNRKAHRPI